MSKQNFLLGKGENLVSSIVVKSGPNDKVPPYTFEQAKTRLQPMLELAASKLDALPDQACPDGQVVGALTLNPEYIAKSYYPALLLKQVGLEAVGSKSVLIKPEKKSKNREPEKALSTQLFVRGTKAAFRDWSGSIQDWQLGTKVASELVTIEAIDAPDTMEKIKGNLPSSSNAVMEIVLHSDELLGEKKTLGLFKDYLKFLQIDPIIEKKFYAGGLCFVQLEAPADKAPHIAQFTLVRALRRMPQLRMLRPTIRATSMPAQSVMLPKIPALDQKIKAAIFDGGLSTENPMTEWATLIDGIGSPNEPSDIEHGTGVTSAFLFGHIDPKLPLSTPYCNVDHHRVLDSEPGQDPTELYEVLERIKAVLTKQKYQLVNLSLGPVLPVEDDEVHAWTAVLDDLFAGGDTLATIAVGNTGESDAASGLNRIQVPADCVNALAVGACDTPDTTWQRAPYSSIGPGRSPGLIKPDLVEFGGSLGRPFLVVGGDNQTPSLFPTGGTSFSAPSTLRLAAGVKAHFGSAMDMLTIRALLVHTAEQADLPMHEIGRGRIARDLDTLVVCGDDTIRVVYQGTISPAKYVRAPIPLPLTPLLGKVAITATLCYTTPVDPHHPGNYTQAGLDVIFRPHDSKRKKADQLHADTSAFFSKGQKGLTEEELRRDAWKWENSLHATANFYGSSLQNPAFDIHYNSRMESYAHNPSSKLRYAMVITVQAPRIADLYDQVVRRYPTQLVQMRPIIDIPVRV
jgi:Subtilase family